MGCKRADKQFPCHGERGVVGSFRARKLSPHQSQQDHPTKRGVIGGQGVFGKRIFIVLLFVISGLFPVAGQEPDPASFEPFDPLTASFPASVPVEIQERITNAGKQPASVFQAARTAMAAPSFALQDSGYILLDAVQNYTGAGTTINTVLSNLAGFVGMPWMPMDDYPSSVSPNPVVSRSLVASPFGANTPGTFAIWQSAVGTTYSYCNERRVGKVFDVGGVNGPTAKLGFYLSINRYCSSCYYDTAGVQVFLFRGNGMTGYWTIGSGGGWIIPNSGNTTSLPNGYNGYVEMPLNFGGQFDKMLVTALDYACVGNNVTYLDEIYFKPDLPGQVLTAQTAPGTLWVSSNGAGSGIVFRATTNAPTTLSFFVRTPQGQEYAIGSRGTEEVNGENVAKISWWGDLGGGNLALAGNYTLIARAGGSEKTAGFQVKETDATIIGMGTWMKASKDPSAAVPPDPKAEVCPSVTWEQAINQKEGYTAGLSLSDPVDIFSGNFNHAEVDLSLKARYPLTLARIYNSLDASVGPFGRGWASPYLARIEKLALDAVFVNSDGSRVLFKNTGPGYQGPTWTDLQLEWVPDAGYWKLWQPSKLEWHFDENGKIMRMSRNCCGQGAADADLIDYDGNGQLHRVTNPAGQWLEFAHDTNGRIIGVSDSTGRTLGYGYSADGLLTSVIDPIGRVTEYEYGEDGFLTQVRKPGNRATNIVLYESTGHTGHPTGQQLCDLRMGSHHPKTHLHRSHWNHAPIHLYRGSPTFGLCGPRRRGCQTVYFRKSRPSKDARHSRGGNQLFIRL